ncbi:hypothetical protein N185_15705 [Sinorhizobium sp. GW3]|nr:hypothetical protein N185_15705 [Sinorhizobium sp. GW3]
MVSSFVCLAPAVVIQGLLVASSALAGEIYTTDGIAINGYDAVSYFVDNKAVKGSSEFNVQYKGATFYFSSLKNREIFAGDPVRYTPQYGGYCAYGTADGHKATTEPDAFTIVDGKLYLNYNADILKTWRADTLGYIRKADANWDEVKGQADP